MKNKKTLLIFVLLIAISVIFYSVKNINQKRIPKTGGYREVPAYEQNQIRYSKIEKPQRSDTGSESGKIEEDRIKEELRNPGYL